MDQINDFFKIVSVGFALLIPLANPITSMTMLLSLSERMTVAERNAQISQSAIDVFSIMCVTYFAGSVIMRTFGISVPGLGIAGGLIVAYIGFGMLFPQASAEDAVGDIPEVAQNAAVPHHKVPNIAFVPLALPGTAGPGTIALIISAASTLHATPNQYAAWVIYTAPVVVFALLALIFWLCLRSAGRLVKLVGDGGVEAISRIMGLLLVCMGVQFIINAVFELIRQFGTGGAG